MPTPSSNVPDARSPREQPFSSCPDIDDDTTTHPRSPSAWQPTPPYPSAMDTQESPVAESRDESDLPSRSNTLSPRPQSSSEGTAREPEGDADGMLTGRDDGNDSHKQTDTDEDMTGVEASSSAGVSGRSTQTRGETYSHTLRGGADTETHAPRRLRRRDTTSPLDAESDKFDETGLVEPGGYVDTSMSGMGYSNMRVIPISPSSYLRPGSRFHGTQQSERQIYNVQVEIKHVDLRESFLCGYLRIQGLTEDHPTLTTYFEGEIIGSKYGFITQHASWGATDKIDLNHWSKFAAFRPFAKQVRKSGSSSGGSAVHIKDLAQRENIFMRWKEHFLVPNHRVRTINGASFEGFYYICFNQVKGEVSGIYFHAKSEKFQQLELKHIEDRGCFGAMEFR